MTLFTQLNTNLKNAMKAKDHVTRDTLRAMITAIKNEAINQKIVAQDLSEEKCLEVIKRLYKQREDAVRAFHDGGREELAQKERREAEIISQYLPEQMSDDVIAQIVAEVIDGGATDFGAVMGQVMARTKGQADGARVRQIVQKALQS